jgi:hypothetical protein
MNTHLSTRPLRRSARRICRTLSRLQHLARHGARLRDYGIGLLLGSYVSMAHASILGPKVCTMFKTIAGNDLYSVAAGIGFLGLLIANAMDEGGNTVKTAALKIGAAALFLVNLQNVVETVTGAAWGC